MAELTEVEQRMLDFEERTWIRPGAKESAIRAEFGMGMIRYCWLLSQLIKRPEAEQRQPVLVHRLRRLQEAEMRRKYARRGR
jgi:hypothetical protein